MQALATAVLIGVFILVSLVYFFSLRQHRKFRLVRERIRLKEKERAWGVHPAYQAKVAADRNNDLALRKQDQAEQKQAVELKIMQDRFALERYLALHRVAEGQYSINEPISTYTAFPKPTPTQKVLSQGVPLQLPPRYDLIDIYRTTAITPEQIFLGKDQRGNPIFCKANQLHHGAFNAATGRGKTMLERGILTQLLFIGHLVMLCDLKFAPVTEGGEDWRPIAKRLYQQEPIQVTPERFLSGLVTNEADIADLLHYTAYTEIERRLAMRRRGDYSYKTLDIFIEELLAFIKAYPDAADDIVRIIALGRDLRLNVFTAAQNFLARDTNMSGGARENFITAYFLGGDMTSGCKILDMKERELSDFLHANNLQLGRGIGMLRNEFVQPMPSLVLLGTSSNESVYYLLGRADDFILPEEREITAPCSSSVPATSRNRNSETLPTKQRAAYSRNTAEPDTQRLEAAAGTPEQDLVFADHEPFNPLKLLTPEQRSRILTAATQPETYNSLRKIREYAGISNETHKFRAMKRWLELNGYHQHSVKQEA